MESKAKDLDETQRIKHIEEQIQRLKYSMIYDYRNRKNQEALLMFVMDV